MNEGKEAQRRRGMKREGETKKVKREGLRKKSIKSCHMIATLTSSSTDSAVHTYGTVLDYCQWPCQYRGQL